MENRKLFQTLCLGAAVLSTGLPAEAEWTEPIVYYNKSGTCDIEDNLNITTTKKEVFNSIDSAVYLSSSSDCDATLNLKGDVKINLSNENAFALYVEGFDGTSGTINVNHNKNKMVQIIGNVKADNYGEINLNLQGKDSYFAGKMETSGNGKVKLNLSNKAVWYVPKLAASGDETWNFADNKITLNSDGGVLDFYHTAPNTSRTGTYFRTVKFANYTGGNLKDTTFIIKSDINGGEADKIVLSGSGNSITNKETYNIQVAYDPSITKNDLLTASKDIPVFDAAGLSNRAIEVIGQSYETDAYGGLYKMKLTPTIT